ncbi:MAG TPA: DUF4838 domain-containing protein [Clostridiales bacterium]|nr:MAG: hypothetical protein BWY37_01752 [Firmicutes bacterium ADurb.Bin262]HOU09877.1 DUF4838 domain-containing protein [Clostridiales bacterium]HQH62037.1 DUF4838 domain-containing protein [Clostridiales bacterium]HQK72745.1 DUF4838 domain-containing protein [Clostridiales bacterium]
MDWTFLEQYTKQAKLLLRVLSLLLCGVTFFTATVPGWFAEKYEGLPADTAAFSTVPVDADPAAPRITLAENGASGYVIVAGKNACFSERTAAAEMAKYLKKISGADIEVVTDDISESAREIVIGRTNREGKGTYTVDRAFLGDDGFVIKVAGEKLVIAGGEKRGTLYGVYTFLEEFLGCRWYSKQFEIVPSVNPVTVKRATDVRQKPFFTLRDCYWDCAQDSVYRAKVKLNSIQADSPVKPMEPYIDVIEGVGYSFEGIINGSRYFQKHPEYFYVDSTGKRNPGQLCLTNPDVQKILKEYICGDILNHPDKELFTLYTNDSADVCLCDACSAVNNAEGTCVGTLMRLVGDIAGEVARIRPDATFRTLIWGNALTPPALTPIPANVSVQLCSIGCNMAKPYETDSPAFCEYVRNWSAAGCELNVWDYSTNFTNYSMPCPNIGNIDDNIRFMAANNITGYFMQGNAYGNSGEFGELRSYLTAKMLWNPDCDIEAVKTEFLRAYYGAGYRNIQAYIDFIAQHAKERFDIICDPDQMLVLNEKQAAQCDAWWDAAEAAANGAGELARVQRSRIQMRYLKSELRLGEFSRRQSLSSRWDEGEKLYDDMQRFGVTYICQGRALKERDRLFFIQNANEWKQ